ncbi:hypothetical protein M1L60_35430 [Actinoplanes sp. TRM 88003]|uniref:Lipoprotein n=1 Tax=Paractinoplanes aksuensis TaxID=2939490 RepID=A0ABT1DYF3_9ACTN|nr:hypothetical protein [Actinoplanes aksuensis]MCO8275884.1 hypothetical protein [Actinoplanes aksuensis]
MITAHRLAAIATLAALGACSADPTPSPTPATSEASPVTSRPAAPTTAAAAAKPVKVPAVADGELVRRVITIRDGVSHGQTTVRRDADRNREYMVQAACAAEDPARILTYVVKVGANEREYVRGEFPCDGTVRQDGISRLERGQILVYLEGGPVASAYAVIVPMTAG